MGQPSMALFKACMLSLLMHCALFIILAPSLGFSVRPSVQQQSSVPLRAFLMGNVSVLAPEVKAGPSPVFPHEGSNEGQSAQDNIPKGGGGTSPQAIDPEDSSKRTPIFSDNEKKPVSSEKTFGLGLSSPPQLLNEITVEYPAAAGMKDGKVLLRIAVSEKGGITGMQILKGEPPGLFEEAALKAFSRAEFAPGEFLGVPVQSDYVVEVEFLPISRDNTAGRGY